ncbi:MAG: hypothetical protein JKX72_04630, partial [Robiginitomaculum sp.]|nr:hypothetical protein [Robiginitomaculum sp.]
MQNGRNMGPGNMIAPTSHGRPVQNGRMPYPPRTLPPPPLRAQQRPASTPQQQGQYRPQHNSFRVLNRPPPLPQTQDDMPVGGEFTMPVNPVGTGNNYVQTAADRQSGRLMLLASLAFLIFYILIVSSKLFNDHNTNKRLDLTEHKTHVTRVSNQISSTIKYIGIWINNGISEGKTASQSARMIALSPMVTDVAILNAQNKIIAQSSESANFLTQVSFNNLANDAFKVTSIITPNGQTIPVLIKKTGNYYLVAALSKMALFEPKNVQSSPDKLALIASSGRVIYGQAELGKVGPLDWFNLSEADFEKITNSNSTFFAKINIHGIKYRLISAQIPNSDLKFLEARPRTDTTALTGSLILFATLFLGTCFLVGMLLNSINKQLRAARTIHRQTEISQQRYQAAIEGDRGGIWELDIPENSAYLSASLAGLLGLPRQEHYMTISEFLNLFHPKERDKFLSVARRAHIQGEFEIDV